MTIAYVECLAGASLDKFLGAWFDLGLPKEIWQTYMSSLLEDVTISFQEVIVKGISATKVTIAADAGCEPISWNEVRRIVDNCHVPLIVKRKSIEVFEHLSHTEAELSKTATESITIATREAVIYVVGNALAWYLHGEPECFVSNIQIGGGVVKHANETITVPTSVTTRLLLGYPLYSAGLWGETVNSVTAAFVRTFMRPIPQKTFIAENIGHGAGDQDIPVADIVRIQLGNWAVESNHSSTPVTERPAGRAVILETNIDDMNPEWAGHLVERLISMGAMDAYWIPVVMKKGRPGLQLRVACSLEKQSQIQEEIARQTTTIGMRIYDVGKWSVPRKFVSVETPYGEISVKLAYIGDEVVNIAPEYEDCRKLANELEIPVKIIYQTALSIAIQEYQGNLKQ